MLKLLEEFFNTRDPYEVLNISQESADDSKALRKAYLQASKVYHPDKAEPDVKELHTKKFQLISKLYEALKDDCLRKSYNETKCWPDGEAYDISTAAFGRLSNQDIVSFKDYYRGSEEERNDIKKYYIDGDGNLLHIIRNVYFASILTDEERIQGIINEMIEDGSMTEITTKAMTKSQRSAAIRKAKKEEKELEGEGMLTNLDNLEGLASIIAKRAQSRDGFLDHLEKKYASCTSKKPKKQLATASERSKKSTLGKRKFEH